MIIPGADSHLTQQIIASPNHNARRSTRLPMLLVLHYTGMPTAGSALERLCDEQSEVSAHYFVDEQGLVLQLVPESRRAWHAGKSYWAGETDINSCSIGIEIAHKGHEFAPDSGLEAFPNTQIKSLIQLARDICARHGISPHHVLAHSDVAPMRKMDPGETFPWDYLAAHGVGVLPLEVSQKNTHPPPLELGDKGQDVLAFKQMLTRYGYGPLDKEPIYDTYLETIVRAFQRHFRQQRIDGIADRETQHILAELLKHLPSLEF